MFLIATVIQEVNHICNSGQVSFRVSAGSPCGWRRVSGPPASPWHVPPCWRSAFPEAGAGSSGLHVVVVLVAPGCVPRRLGVAEATGLVGEVPMAGTASCLPLALWRGCLGHLGGV